MTETTRPELTQEDIRKTAGIIQKTRPAYGALIDFYGQVFVAQVESWPHITLEPIIIDPALLALKQANGMPLIDPSQFSIDKTQADLLLKKICQLAMAHAPKLSNAAEKLLMALTKGPHINGPHFNGPHFNGPHFNGTFDPAPVYLALLNGQKTEEDAKMLDITSEELTLFFFSAMAPSIQSCAVQLAAYLKGAVDQKNGYCPICGSHPDVAYLDPDGKKFLVCSLCAHEWQTHRMGCVFCDSTDRQDQHYFFNTEEKEYRVYVCDNCQSYLKLVDLRQLDRSFVPKLEQITTLHLDFKAQEKGYTSATHKAKI